MLPFIQFQRYRFRTGAAFKADLGAIGIKRTSGPNVFELKRIPDIEGIGLRRSAAFTKASSGKYKLLAEIGMNELFDQQGFKPKAEGEYQATRAEKGIYTIYYLVDISGLVEQLNAEKNADIRDYLMRTKDARIITAVVKVASHSLDRTSSGSFSIEGFPSDEPEKEGSAELESVKSKGGGDSKGTRIVKDESPGLKLHDGSTYAYEYSRVLWDVDTGRVVDLLVDQPNGPWSFGDPGNHSYQGVTSNPRKIKAR